MIDEITPVAIYITDEILKNSNGFAVSVLKRFNSIAMAETKVSAYGLWAIMVAPGCTWDHKPLIAKKFSSSMRDKQWLRYEPTKKDYNYDIWSNIHYGYVGRAAGFSEEELLMGAGVAQLKTSKSNECSIINLKLCDDPKDQYAIKLGFKLFNISPNGFTYRILLSMLVADTEVLSTRDIAQQFL